MRAVTYLGAIVGLALVGFAVLKLTGSETGGVLPGGAAKQSNAARNEKGEYVTNPFGKPQPGAAPKLTVDSNEFDFGLMGFPLVDKDGDGQADGDAHTFVVKNTGDAVLKLARGPSTCQCTMAALEDIVEVKPGESTEISVSWEPTAPDEEFSKAASIWTNDPALFAADSEFKDGRIQFAVKGKVVNAVEAEPSYFSLGTLQEQQPTPFSTLVFSRISDSIEVKVKEASSQHITVNIVPATAEELEQHKALSGVHVNGEIAPKLPIGRVKESVTLTTNDATKPEIQLEIEGQRHGPMSIAGRFWNQGYTMIDFGKFPAEKGISTTLNLYGSKQDPPLELKLVESRPEGLIVTAERDSAYAEETRDRWLIKVEVPAGRPSERLVGKEAGLVRFETNNKDVPEMKFHVLYESR